MDGRAQREIRRHFAGGMGRGAIRMAKALAVVGALCLPLAGFGQAMGKISIDGPSPLPVGPVMPAADAVRSAPVAAPGPVAPAADAGRSVASAPPNSGLVAAMPATPTSPVAPAAGTPNVDLTQRAPLPLPSGGGGTSGAAGNPGTPGTTDADATLAAPSVSPLPAVTGEPRTGASAAALPAVPVAPEVTGPAGAGGHDVAGSPSAASPGVTDIERTPIGGRSESPRDGGTGAGPEVRKPAGVTGMGVGQVIAALTIVIGLIFVGRALMKRFVPGAMGGSGKGVIEILARHPLSKNQSLVLVRIGSQIVALNQGKDASQSVLVISEPMEVAKIIGQIEGKNPNSSQAGFSKLLANARIDLEENGAEEPDLKSMSSESLDEQLEEMAAAKRQLMELRQHVRSVRDRLPKE